MQYKIINKSSIKLGDLKITINQLHRALINTNEKIKEIGFVDDGINLFNIIDFRVFSGMIGELFAKELSLVNNRLERNPNLNGYPDLLNIASPKAKIYFENCEQNKFLRFKYGGIEVKNSFGTKKSKTNIVNGDQRIEFINNKIDWKAHHQETNYLIGLVSDYINSVPKIVAVCYSNDLEKNDWNKVQKPKGDSAMTSFTAITREGYAKMVSNIKICLGDIKYLKFFNCLDNV